MSMLTSRLVVMQTPESKPALKKKTSHPLAASDPMAESPQADQRESSTSSSASTSMLGARIPADLHKRLKHWSIDTDVSTAQLLSQLLSIFMDENDPLGKEMRKRILEG